MVLIDSLYINNSGGLRLLCYLIDRLNAQKIPFYLLADKRCENMFNNVVNVEYLEATLKNRIRWYYKNKKKYSAVFCFGNIPVPKKLDVPVYTYFHNINLLTQLEYHNLALRVKSWLKREIIRFYKKNTNLWLVQTSNTANELIKHLRENPEKVKLMPFFEIQKELELLAGQNHGDGYVFVSNYTGAKGHEELLEAWRILHKKGIDKELHLTVPNKITSFIEKINKAQLEGIKVINHGFVSFEKVTELYHKSKAIIYPSHNESLGLGLVEAMAAGCDVIASDKSYVHSICKPSLVFNPYSAESIAEAVLKYEEHNFEKSECYIKNNINELIKLLKGDLFIEDI